MPQAAMLDIADFGGNMTLKGPLQDSNKGEKRFVWVVAFRHSAECEIDPKTGLPAKTAPVGGRPIVNQSPVVITKKLDYTTPAFHRAYMENTTLSPWRLQFWQIPMSGEANHYFTIHLTGAKVQSIRTIKPPMFAQNVGAAHELEEVAFTYDKIKVEALAAKRGLSYGTAPASEFEYDSKMEPDWRWVQAKAAAEKYYGIYSEKLTSEIKAKLIADGILTAEGLPGANFNK